MVLLLSNCKFKIVILLNSIYSLLPVYLFSNRDKTCSEMQILTILHCYLVQFLFPSLRIGAFEHMKVKKLALKHTYCTEISNDLNFTDTKQPLISVYFLEFTLILNQVMVPISK